MAEYIDVCDYDGNKLGFYVERGRHHHKDWWYLCIHAYVVDRNGNFLLQRRSLKKKYYPGIWDITCGAVDSGEAPIDAAIREVKEEIGLDVSDFECTFAGLSRCHDCLNHVYLFKGSFELDELTLDPEEVMDVKFLTADEMISFVKSSEFKDPEYHYMIENFLKNIF